MRPYLLSSAALHFLFLGLFGLFSWFMRPKTLMIIDGFEFMGDGGGGDGREGGGRNSGMKPKDMGQVVPQPIKVPVPEKPAPVQKAIQAEETWKVKNAKEIKPVPVPKREPENPTERGEKPQEEKTNVIRLGTAPNQKVGEGFDFGEGSGTGGGNGEGKGLGLGIGFGPGEGGGFGGFGGYLRIMRQRIWSEWAQRAVYGSDEVCVVGLTVARSGDVSDVRLEKPSNNPFYDNVALRAVRDSSPLPPLPLSFPSDTQRFRIKFRLIE